MRDDLDTFAECGAFDHFRQLILAFSIAARFSTPLVCSPFMEAPSHCRAQAALAGTQGVKLFTIDQLAARLAGGFLQPVDGDHLAAAVAEAIKLPRGELDAVKALPGFQRAAASRLSKAWGAASALPTKRPQQRTRRRGPGWRP